VLTKFMQKHGVKIVQWLPLLLTGLLAIGLLSAVLLQKFQSQPDIGAIEQVRSPAALNFNWFGGKAAKQAIDLSDIPDNLPTANLNAQVLGVVVAGDKSTVAIKFSGSKEVVHFIGDEIAGQTKIIDIQSYRIVVLQGGIKKQMVMKKPDSVIEQSIGSGDTNADASNGFALANMFGAVPVMAGGTTGFKINNLSSEMQQLADIQDGDVVTQVNGSSMQDIMADPSNWLKFSASTNLPVTVIRGGQEQIIYINAASLSAKMMPNLGFKP